jgi:hypothetical protein
LKQHLASRRLAGTLGLAIACLPARGATEPCVARAELGGEADVVARVGLELARLGVERGKPAPGCRGVMAQVETDHEGGISVAIQDGARRSEGRVVSDVAMAASWIDSWLHDELDGNAWLISAPVRVAAAPGTTPPATPITTKHVVTTSSVLDRMSLTVAYEHAWSDDGATANGISGGGCLRIGGVCLGGRARYAREPDRTVELTAMSRSDLSLLATGSMPIRAGRMVIAPEIGLGIGRTSTRRLEGCVPDTNMPPPNCDPMDPTCMDPQPTCTDPNGKIYVGDNFANATYTPRLAAGVRIAVPLFDHVWLDGLASFAFAPFSHGDPFATTATGTNPDGTVGPGGMSDLFALPGESGFGFQLGLGLRIGGR